MTFQIHVSSSQSLLELDDETLIRRACEVLEAEQVAAAEIVVALVDDETIHQVNRAHLNHDYPTDVISFLYNPRDEDAESDSGPRGCGQHLDGELVISVETAIRGAAEYGWTPEDEVTLYLVHGLLHLCGYDDLSDEEQRVMRGQERALLQRWGLAPKYDSSNA